LTPSFEPQSTIESIAVSEPPLLSTTGRRRTLFLWGPVALWVAFILAATSTPGSALPPSPFSGFDLFVHVGIYSGLGFLLYRALYGGAKDKVRRAKHEGQSTAARGWRLRFSGPVAFAAAAAFGALDEGHQLFIPGRYCCLSDWVADALGAGLGALAYWAWLRLLAHRRG
jgi:hypothetical protein